MSTFRPRDLRNERNGGLIRTQVTDLEAATTFAQAYGDQEHWLWYWIHKVVQELPTRDADSALDYINDWFLFAIGRGLKRPMIRAHYKGQRFKLYLSKRGTLCLKTGALVDGREQTTDEEEADISEPTSYDPTGNERYIGCFLRGVFRVARERIAVQTEEPPRYGYRRGRRYSAPVQYQDGPEYKLNPAEVEFLSRLKESPVKFLAECGRDMDRCCFCNLPLEDTRSKEKGYGPICAGRWGLLWGVSKKGEKEAIKTFGEVYNQECHYLCVNVRLNVTDETAWGVLNDWLEERGALPTKKDKQGNLVRAFNPPSGRNPLYPRWDGPVPKRPVPESIEVILSSPTPGGKTRVEYDPPVELVTDPNNVPSSRFTWTGSNKTLTANISSLGWNVYPGVIVVRSDKTGNARTFREKCRDIRGGELVCVRYASGDGIKLVLSNE